MSPISFPSLLLLLLLLFTFNSITTFTNAQSPYDPPTTTSSMLSINTKDDPSLPVKVDIFAPKNIRNATVFLFLSGLNGNMFVTGYSDMLTRISESSNSVVVGLAVFPKSPYSNLTYQLMRDVMEWTWNGGLNKALQGFNTTVNPMSIIGMGHSEGNKAPVAIAINQTEKGGYPRLAGLALLDPVDSDPFNKTTPIINPGTTLPFSLPAIVIASGLGEVPGLSIPGFPACCPPAWSSHHFYNALQAPKWYLNATQYGHADALNPILARGAALSHFCSACNQKLNPADYSLFLGSAVGAFARAIINGEVAMLPYIQDSEVIPIPTVAVHDLGLIETALH